MTALKSKPKKRTMKVTKKVFYGYAGRNDHEFYWANGWLIPTVCREQLNDDDKRVTVTVEVAVKEKE